MSVATVSPVTALSDTDRAAALAAHLAAHRIGAPASTDLGLLEALHDMAHAGR